VIFGLFGRRGVETDAETVWSMQVSEAPFRNGSREGWSLSLGASPAAVQLETALGSVTVYLHGVSRTVE